MTATTFDGNLSGNVTGNVTGTLFGNVQGGTITGNGSGITNLNASRINIRLYKSFTCPHTQPEYCWNCCRTKW